MKKFVTREEFPQVEMELFSKTYPCHLILAVFVVDTSIPLKVRAEAHVYETEFINGEWLLKTKDN